MTKKYNFPSPSMEQAIAIQTWDEVMLIAGECNISAEAHSILTSGLNNEATVFDVLDRNKWLVQSIKRLGVIRQLLESSANGFNEIFNKAKAQDKLENERKKIISEIRRLAEPENAKQRQLRLNQEMERLTKQGMTERDASEKLASEEALAGRKPLTAETIRRNFHKS